MADLPKSLVKKPDVLPKNLVYVGFWLRLWASLLDTILVSIIVLPVLRIGYGAGLFSGYPTTGIPNDFADWLSRDPWSLMIKGPLDFFVSWVFPAVAVITFWICRSATPGKMAIGARIVDARCFTTPTVKQLVGRYFAYYLSMLPIVPPLGMVWIAFDRRKQGWHDKLAGTVVVRERGCNRVAGLRINKT